MTRLLALFGAILLTTISFATTGVAAASSVLRFELAERDEDRIQVTLSREDSGRHRTSISLRQAELAGLSGASLRSSAQEPVRFALTRDAGRLDCNGSGAMRRAAGTCRFTADPSFASFLATSGVSRPSDEEMLSMTMVGTSQALVQGLRNARFGAVTSSDLIAMTAVGVTPEYIRDLAAHGYRPRKPADLIPLKALDISPAYIRSLRSVGYDRLTADELIQLKALEVSADFISSLQRRGYRNLAVSRLVQLKALSIQPEDLQRPGRGRGSPRT
jgi:hypothetical protein